MTALTFRGLNRFDLQNTCLVNAGIQEIYTQLY